MPLARICAGGGPKRKLKGRPYRDLVELVDDEDVLTKMVYALSNPVKDFVPAVPYDPAAAIA